MFLVYKASQRVFEKFGAKKISFQEFKKEFKTPYMKYYKKFIKKPITRNQVITNFQKAFKQLEPPGIYPDVKETLAYFRKKGIKMIVLTSVPDDLIEIDLKNHGLGEFFSEVNSNVHDKTECILDVIKRNGFDPKETIYVGDMTHDIHAAKKANIRIASLYRGYQSKSILAKENPDFLIKDLRELKKIVQ
jgi:HAD superfamily hydrolase (TIGR01549 family)